MPTKKNTFIFSLIILTLIFLVGFFLVYFPLNSKPSTQQIVEDTEPEITISKQALEYMATFDIESLSSLVGEAGIIFSSNGYFNESSIHFSKESFLEASNSGEKYIWGYTDGRGDTIESDLRSFFQTNLYNRDFLSSEKISLNRLNHESNSLFNATEFFPGEVTFVDVYLDSEDPSLAEYDWASLIFIFQHQELIGITYRTWSI